MKAKEPMKTATKRTTKYVGLQVSREVYFELKRRSLMTGQTMSSVVRDILNKLVKK